MVVGLAAGMRQQPSRLSVRRVSQHPVTTRACTSARDARSGRSTVSHWNGISPFPIQPAHGCFASSSATCWSLGAPPANGPTWIAALSQKSPAFVAILGEAECLGWELTSRLLSKRGPHRAQTRRSRGAADRALLPYFPHKMNSVTITAQSAKHPRSDVKYTYGTAGFRTSCVSRTRALPAERTNPTHDAARTCSTAYFTASASSPR